MCSIESFEFKQRINTIVISEIAKGAFGNESHESKNKAADQILNSKVHKLIQLLSDEVATEISRIKKSDI